MKKLYGGNEEEYFSESMIELEKSEFPETQEEWRELINQCRNVNEPYLGEGSLLHLILQAPITEHIDPIELEERVNLLLARGANVNKKDQKGNLPLHYAVNLNSANIVRSLLKKTESVDEKNKDHHTPLGNAIMSSYAPKRKEIIQLLLEAGANPNSEYHLSLQRHTLLVNVQLFPSLNKDKIEKSALLIAYGAEYNYAYPVDPEMKKPVLDHFSPEALQQLKEQLKIIVKERIENRKSSDQEAGSKSPSAIRRAHEKIRTPSFLSNSLPENYERIEEDRLSMQAIQLEAEREVRTNRGVGIFY